MVFGLVVPIPILPVVIIFLSVKIAFVGSSVVRYKLPLSLFAVEIFLVDGIRKSLLKKVKEQREEIVYVCSLLS